MGTDGADDEFVTIVPVGEVQSASSSDPAFVTVLTVGAAARAAEVTVRRPKGARLGLGLKFEGGSAAAEKVRRLLVQSCAEDSPAASASAPWGKLIPGDEILAIDNVSVSELTRIDCVRRLKDSDELLKLLVRHFDISKQTDGSADTTDSKTPETSKYCKPEIKQALCLPPPVPPRKLNKKNSFKDRTLLQDHTQGTIADIKLEKDEMVQKDHNIVFCLNGNNKLSRKSSFDSHLLRQNKENFLALRKGSPEEVRRLARRLSDGKSMPPEAEIYVDLLSQEWERCLALADAESDDTGSSISTVVDRLGSMTNSVENSIPSTPILQPKSIDFEKVLNCIQNADIDLIDNDASKNFLGNNTEETKSLLKIESRSSKNSSDKLTHDIPIFDDNNNNTAKTITSISIDSKSLNIDDRIQDFSPNIDPAVIPKPKPRNLKPEKKNNVKSEPQLSVDTSPNIENDVLLTPTKKNNIETWLQRSEAELTHNTNDQSYDETNPPEALPRLIDFVPKPHFKDSEDSDQILNEVTFNSSTVPPAECREDGSGASLDTIGELDEPNDSAEEQKAQPKELKASSRYESSFWEERTTKSDADDSKSLSNDETPPSCPRQPPDGVEAPFEVVEKAKHSTASTRLAPRLSAPWPTGRYRTSYSRSQDARSECSVKDKIAMFSCDSTSYDQLDKCNLVHTKVSTPSSKSNLDRSNNYSVVGLSLDRRLTKSQDNLDEVTIPDRIRTSERPLVLGEQSRINGLSDEDNLYRYKDSKPTHFASSSNLLLPQENKTYSANNCHVRSASMGGCNRSNSYKSTLEYLIEQRKKSMSKLRGLMIQEPQGPIIDLPEIKVRESFSCNSIYSTHQNKKETNDTCKTTPVKNIALKDSWQPHLINPSLPKYSPAFKRKSLQVYGSANESYQTGLPRTDRTPVVVNINKPTPSKPPRFSIDNKKNGVSHDLPIGSSVPKFLTARNQNIRNYSTVEVKIVTATEVVDSDNDSAMSSTQSSYRSSASSPLNNMDSMESDSSHLSPRTSHCLSYSIAKTEIPFKENGIKSNVCRTISSDTTASLSSSTGSGATSGSQASCSSLESSVNDTHKKKIVKTFCVDAVNRRNILASAKCRSGKDINLSSPVIETKFSHDTCEKSPSPESKSSDRLATLTSTVSAVPNKGENRRLRSSKIIRDSDSDSDSNLNIRHRKSDYKTQRAKKCLNLQSKVDISRKPTLDHNDISVNPPKLISERIIQEIKKAGLNDFVPNKEKLSISTSSLNGRTGCDNFSIKEVESGETAIKNVASKLELEEEIKTQNVTSYDQVDSSGERTHKISLARREGAGVGLILAGGVDCEAKDVTVHRVLRESVAEKAGLRRGARVVSINGCATTGLTHAQTVALLKEPRPEVTIEVEKDIPDTISNCGSDSAESKDRESMTDGSLVSVVLEKCGGGAGLGFGLDGGRDSPRGDCPLTIKKLFSGGAAARSGRVVVGAQLVSAGGIEVSGFTRTQAWAALKTLPAGPVTLVLRLPNDKK